MTISKSEYDRVNSDSAEGGVILRAIKNYKKLKARKASGNT